jgi:hypothetical protein
MVLLVSPASTISNSYVGIYGIRMILTVEIISLNSVNHFIFVMVKCCVFFAVRTQLSYII